MKSFLLRLVVLYFVFCFVVSEKVSAQSPLPHGTPSIVPADPPAPEIAPVPTHWFSDYAKATSPIFAIELDRRLEHFEHETTNQFVVIIYPKLPLATTVDDYCLRLFNAWHVGQKGVNNGVILFVFMEDHKLRIEVGRGLEFVLTNPVCQEIVNSITLRFRAGDYEGGITAGVDAVVKTIQTQGPPQHIAH